MKFGVPSKGRCDTTGRAKMFIFYAENCADELWLTRLEKALNGQLATRMTIELEDGTEINLNGNPDEEASEEA